MAPAAILQTPTSGAARSTSPPKRAWTEQRPEIPSILVGRGQENASTARHTLEQGMDSERKSSENTGFRVRQNSLKRAKNSTDVLRQRSLKGRDGKGGVVDSNPTTREGRQCTVANVGNNGKIYLRPIAQTTPKSLMPPSAHPAVAHSNGHRPDTDIDSLMEKKRWSDTQASRTPTRQRRTNSTDRGTQRSNSMSVRSTKLSRSGSVSTIGAGNNSENAQVKVVINQTDPASRYLGEVSIPHYRLGTPRFSTRGTAILHSQVYSRASTVEDLEPSVIAGSEFDTLFPVPPGVETHSSLPPRYSQNNLQPNTVQMTPAAARIPITTASPVYHRMREPIVPAIYDAIAANPDDPAIVRYALSSREISAASPARLIAQITSKNFLDYELLSDFFLTVRAYLSTHDLLDYLLTRFEWAVNRFDDDGRVIRVRAFAAIRHWVLNYFPYDFVVDRDLRVKFCQHLNTLTHQVRKRSSIEPSDLKLIIDLKKCWNGRCALYWDSPLGDIDGRNDYDITPGGIVGSRDSRLTHPSELWARIADPSSEQVDQAKSVAALHNWVDSVIEAEDQGQATSERGVSMTTSPSLPMSIPLSDQSIQAMSCSIPGKTPKAFATQSQRNVGPHPIPTTIPPAVRRVGPAASSTQANEKPPHLKEGNERSGSFSDALRDKRTSLPLQPPEHSPEQAVMTFPFSGSLIRGSVLPPASPFIDRLAHQKSSPTKHANYVGGLDGSKVTVRPMSPGVKNLLGTIRRAIGSKQNSSTPTPTLLPTAPFMVEVKNSQLPMHIAYKIEGFGDQHHQLEALKNNSRIDLLCADITDMFERAMTQEPRQMLRPESSVDDSCGNEPEELSPDPHQPSGTPEREALQRGHSEMTNGSQSIVIVDDTALKPPVPRLPQEFQNLSGGQPSRDFSHAPFPLTDLSTPSQPAAFQPLIATQPSRPEKQDVDHTASSVLLPPFAISALPSSQPERQSSRMSEAISRVGPSYQSRPSIATGKSYVSYRSSRSGHKSLRKYASYQSGMRISGPDRSMEATTASDSPPTSSKSQFDQPAGRMLRRRPGGDLRANQSVHDLEPITRPKSTGSITTFTDSMHSSGAMLTRTAKNTQPPTPGPVQNAPVATEKAISMMSSRPSQPDLRPSFEAAVAEFARIPDDEGGDLEATLAKLEGKFRKSPVGFSAWPPNAGVATVTKTGTKEQYAQQSRNTKPQNKEHELPSADAMVPPPGTGRNGQPRTAGPGNDHRDTMARSLYADSEESYNSTPLLERGLNQKVRQTAQTTSDQSNVTVPRPLFSPSRPNDGFPRDDQVEESSTAAEDDEVGSYEVIRRGRYRSSVPTCTTDSFLLDEDEFLSDLSSELSDDSEAHNEALDEAFGSSARFMNGGILPPNVGYAQGYLPSPPMTTENAMAITTEANRIQEQRKPPTPEASPVSRITDPGKSRSPEEVDGSVLQPFANTVHQFPPRRHIPFILAYDAAILAQQLTIIERDGLNEINWQDLIDLRSQHAHASSQTLNWVEYLRYQDPTGIELVSARFNLMVKWTLSEIVLTQNIEERALAIKQYIQIAQHAWKYHNYATVLQIAMALTSVDCQRLTRTWDLVPADKKATLKEMEALHSPIKNFHNLRQDMEAANLDEGCIPFVALYTRDLTYNAQKPSVVASTRVGEPLINFERFRTSATIVKSLLRLIDASAKYDFRPVEGALERCLWMASLSDDMIRIKSREIEP